MERPGGGPGPSRGRRSRVVGAPGAAPRLEQRPGPPRTDRHAALRRAAPLLRPAPPPRLFPPQADPPPERDRPFTTAAPHHPRGRTFLRTTAASSPLGHRMKNVAQRRSAPMSMAVLDEGVIRRLIGGRAVRAAHASDRVLRAPQRRRAGGSGRYRGVRRHRRALRPAALDGDEMAHLGTALSGHIVEGPEEAAVIKRRRESLRAEALSCPASLRPMREGADQCTP